MARIQKHPKIGLALSAGSARGIAHIGVLKALVENEIPIDCIAGTSAGAIVAALFAFGIPLEKIQEKGKGLNWFSLSGFPNSKLGLTSSQPLEKIIGEMIGDVAIEEANIQLAITATNIESGTNVIFQKGKASLAVRASSSIPGLFSPVEMDGVKFVDGGLSENTPVSALEEMGARIKISVNVVHWHSDRKVENVLDVMSNAMDILAARQEAEVRRHSDIVIEPDLADYSPSDFKKADDLVREGYRATMIKMPEIKSLLAGAHPKKKRRPIKDASKGFWSRIISWLVRV